MAWTLGTGAGISQPGAVETVVRSVMAACGARSRVGAMCSLLWHFHDAQGEMPTIRRRSATANSLHFNFLANAPSGMVPKKSILYSLGRRCGRVRLFLISQAARSPRKHSRPIGSYRLVPPHPSPLRGEGVFLQCSAKRTLLVFIHHGSRVTFPVESSTVGFCIPVYFREIHAKINKTGQA
jgi:hypothetical protein